ncbi:MAG: hypothetical protein JOY58_07735 [Solirubrobacterales bacterium]|nr:hypothetical protein [Solirubrobacterales bacterium]
MTREARSCAQTKLKGLAPLACCKLRGLVPLACRTDKVDARVLAELSFGDLVPAI